MSHELIVKSLEKFLTEVKADTELKNVRFHLTYLNDMVGVMDEIEYDQSQQERCVSVGTTRRVERILDRADDRYLSNIRRTSRPRSNYRERDNNEKSCNAVVECRNEGVIEQCGLRRCRCGCVERSRSSEYVRTSTTRDSREVTRGE